MGIPTRVFGEKVLRVNFATQIRRESEQKGRSASNSKEHHHFVNFPLKVTILRKENSCGGYAF